MCRISLNQIQRSIDVVRFVLTCTFEKTDLPIYYEKKEKLSKSNKIKYKISMINYKGDNLLLCHQQRNF